MFGTALRLLATGVAGRRVGEYVKHLTTRYLVLGMAGMVFSIATVFGILAGFWALNTWTQNPVWSALIMLGILALAGFLIVLIAYGITREKPQSARQALQNPMQAMQSQIPSIEDVGHQIEQAVRLYGPFRVAAAAAAGGLVAGLLAKRFGQVNVYEPRRDAYDSRRARGNGRRYA
jgi:membrane associated rhomboid family serine protease